MLATDQAHENEVNKECLNPNHQRSISKDCNDMCQNMYMLYIL